MSIRVTLENVGGLKGTHTFEFIRGIVNLVKAPNAAGKTSLIRAIASCLSVPYQSESVLKLAREMGLLKQPGETLEPLIHVSAKVARVTIEIDGEEWKYMLFKDGRYTYTKRGDERFLVTSVVTRDSKILKSLISGDTDFKWVLETVSLADRYEKAAIILEEEVEKVKYLLDQVESRRVNVERLRSEEEKLKMLISKYEHKREQLNKAFIDLLAKHPEADELKKQREFLQNKARDLEKEINGIENRIKSIKRRIIRESEEYEKTLREKKQLEKKLEALLSEQRAKEERLKTLNKKLKDFEDKIRLISEQIEMQRIEEGRLLSRLEIYEKALKLASGSQKVLCFLCEQGYLTIETLERQRLMLQKRLSEVRDEIAKLISERNDLYRARNEKKDIEERLKEIRKECSKITGKLQKIEASLVNYAQKIGPLKKTLKSLEDQRNRKKQEYDKYKAELSIIEKAVRDLDEEIRRVSDELAEVRGRLDELKRELNNVIERLELEARIEIKGTKLSLEKAEKILSAWLTMLEDIIRKIRTEARRERIMAAELFNRQVRKVLRESNFEYLDVWIDASDYRLHIMDKRLNKEITPRILSETERYMLALVIHTALKLAYTSHIPFFLIDEVFLSFDEVRRRAMLDYLSNLAKENNWVILVTELGHEPEIKVSVLINP